MTGIQSGPDAFDELKFVMIFLTVLGILLYQMQKTAPLDR